MPAVGSVVLGIRLVLAAVFAVAGVAKLFDRNGSRQALADFGVPAPAVPVAAWLLPLVELATAIALIPPSSARWGALAALVLLLGFVAGIANALRRGKDVDCGCFGKLYSAVAGRATLARNAALAVGAGIVLWQGPGPSIGDWVSARTAAELVAVAAVAAALVLGVAVVRLWRERRDLREDVDELREQLAALPSGLPVGAVAPAFALSDLHGETRTLESLCARGRPVVLVFISPGCGPCQQMLPDARPLAGGTRRPADGRRGQPGNRRGEPTGRRGARDRQLASRPEFRGDARVSGRGDAVRRGRHARTGRSRARPSRR